MTSFEMAEILWLRLFVNTEEYDRTLPHIVRNAETIPLPGWPMDSSRAFAKKEKERLDSEAAGAGITAAGVRAASAITRGLTLELAREMLAAYDEATR